MMVQPSMLYIGKIGRRTSMSCTLIFSCEINSKLDKDLEICQALTLSTQCYLLLFFILEAATALDDFFPLHCLLLDSSCLSPPLPCSESVESSCDPPKLTR